jgi:hypothetical protein
VNEMGQGMVQFKYEQGQQKPEGVPVLCFYQEKYDNGTGDEVDQDRIGLGNARFWGRFAGIKWKRVDVHVLETVFLNIGIISWDNNITPQ